ncbi:protein FAM81B [Sarcoramphus papa]
MTEEGEVKALISRWSEHKPESDLRPAEGQQVPLLGAAGAPALRRDPSPPPCPRDRARLLEERLSSQERTTAFLLHQAFRIKDDIVSYLQGSKGYQHGETAARRLLENHIQTITSIVKKLSQDIEVLERQIRARDGAAVETNFAVQSLDHKYIQGLGDLRGRVARCEASIAKLSGDISMIRREAQKTDKEIYGLHSALKNCVGDFEKKVMQLLGKIETSNSDQSSNLKTVQGDQHHELQLLDFKLTSILSDFRDQIQTHRKRTEAQLTRSEEDQAQHRHQLLNLVKERLERTEERLEEKLLLLSLKLEQMDKPQKYEKQLNQIKMEEKTLHARNIRFERQIWKELEEIQNEYRSGFQSIHESLELLKQIQNTKLKLEKKKIQKDVKKIK